MESIFKPEIINYMKSVSIEDTFSNENKLRHPGGIYNSASLYVTKSLNKFIDLLETEDIEAIGEQFRVLLYDFFKFYDSSYEILACFCHGHNPLKKKDFIDKWITKNGYSCSNDLKNLLQNDISNLKYLYNKFKHTSNFAGYITIDTGKFKVFGYYLIAYDETGAQLNADNDIYPISFYRETKNLFYLFHKISESLLDILKTHIGIHNNTIDFKAIETPSTIAWEELYNKTRALPKRYFKNEIGKVIFEPKIQNDRIVFDQEILTDANWRKEYPDSQMNINFRIEGDGYTKQFKVPHMGMRPAQ